MLNRDEFTKTVQLYDRDLLRVCYIISRDALVAEDAVQNTWQRLWQHPPRMRDPSKLRQWLLSVAANEARQIMRRDRRRREREQAAIESVFVTPFDEDRVDMASLLARLDDLDRALLALRYLIGLNATEIGDVVQMSPGTVRSRLHRLLTGLRRQLGHE